MPAARSVLAVVVLLAACASEPPAAPMPVDSGAYHHYVLDRLLVPTSAMEQRAYALDIDGDPQGRRDNQLGAVFVALAGNNLNLQDRADAAVADGQVVLLHSLRADDLAADASASWQVVPGRDTPAPRFDGAGAFEAAPGPSDGLLPGAIVAGTFAGGPGELDLELDVSTEDPPLTLSLIGARLEARVSADGCQDGLLGGAVTRAQVDDVLVPSVVGMMNGALRRDPGCPSACTPGSSAALVESLFDADHDGTITVEEVRESPVIQQLLAPDLDLLDAAGAFRPDADGVRESLSVGVGFSCVKGTFTVAGEAP